MKEGICCFFLRSIGVIVFFFPPCLQLKNEIACEKLKGSIAFEFSGRVSCAHLYFKENLRIRKNHDLQGGRSLVSASFAKIGPTPLGETPSIN
jgi:hypothetical protein